jgi:hypothetical protein
MTRLAPPFLAALAGAVAGGFCAVAIVGSALTAVLRGWL